MRHAASLVAAMEGVSRPAFQIARELANNSRSGLTTRFLSKKLELPEEEVEYLVDVNHRFLFTDLTKVKLVPEGLSAVKRITEGLENRGDCAALFTLVKSLAAHDFRRLEEQIGIDKPGAKKAAVEELLERHYRQADAVVTYVATRGFSGKARELFDMVWQSSDGLMQVSKLRAVWEHSDYELEQALWELFRGFALFEMFRFDGENRLQRYVGLLREIRQHREHASGASKKRAKPKPKRREPSMPRDFELSFSDLICRLVAAIAAKPARLRNDGELFREDVRRLEEFCPEGGEPGLSSCLWAAEGAGWLARVDNELRAGALDALIDLDRLSRHRILFDWLAQQDYVSEALSVLSDRIEDLDVGTWYKSLEFVKYATTLSAEHEEPVLKCINGQWQYVAPSATGRPEKVLVRALEGPLFWLGVVARADESGGSLLALTELGRALLAGRGSEQLAERYPRRESVIIVQPNFDIVVPTQDMDPLLTAPLDQFAVRASTGQATVYNVTKDSFTHAVQEGHDGDRFVDFLVAHNRGGALPSNVLMTLEDWRGGMKRVRLRTLHILESDDPLVIADLMHRRRYTKHLAEIDPRKAVLYKKISKADLSKALEKDGFIVE